MRFLTDSIIKTLAATSLFLVLIFLSISSKAQYTINSVYGNLVECDTMTRGIYIVWWDNDADFSTEVDVLLDSMLSYRNTCLNILDMLDPPNSEAGYFYNVYIHQPGNINDIFYPYGWGNGQGTDSNGFPFLTLPDGVLNDWLNNSHETFHIFQYNANSPGYSYSGDSQWYIEASANWFAALQNITHPRAFVEAESLVRIPHVPLWLSYGNYPAYYPSNWQRYVHQYAMALLLYYLTDEAGVSDNTITEGFFNGTDQLPQEYLFNQLGADVFRDDFIDWAAHMTNHFEFIQPYQAATNENEWNTYADPEDDNEFTHIFNNSGNEVWLQPADSLVTTAWSFNTYKLLNSLSETYTFALNGNPVGSNGDSAFFQGKVIVQSSESGTSFHNLNMVSNWQGNLNLTLSPEDTTVYFIIASMPEVFQDENPMFQLFPYEMTIMPATTGIYENNAIKSVSEIGRYNFIGQSIPKGSRGIHLILFDDGSTKKIIVQ